MTAEKKEAVEEKYVKWFSDLSKKDVKVAGGKGANLGEMYNLGLPVPQGFVVIADAYSYFLEETKLKEKIYSILEKINEEDTKQLEETAGKIREMIENSEMPKELEKEIIEAYEILSFDETELKNATADVLNIMKRAKEFSFVAVRSSATAEDSSTASFAGQQETFLNVKGLSSLIELIKKCWASLFTARSVYYRIKKGFRHEDVLIAVVIQLMIDSKKSGVIFSKNPITQEENVVIEAVFGLGEGIVSGRIQPDHYVVNRELKILSKKIAEKKIAIVRDSSGKTTIVKLTEERSKQQVLSEHEIRKLAGYALRLEEHYRIPQDIEFSIDKEIYIVQTRPVTTLEKKESREIEGKEILSGLGASPGIGSGSVKIVRSLKDLEKIKKGDVLVTEMTNPDMVVSMQKCSAIVTDSGGLTAHAAIVSREMGIPAVVGTKNATKILRDGMIVTVDGYRGKVYEGKLEKLKEEKVEIFPIVDTETKIKVMVDLPDFAERASRTGCREVGLLRLEGIIASSGKHPFYFLNKPEEYEEIIFSGLKKISNYFDKLWVRTSDIRSDEFRNLESAPKQEEANPMLGMHGIRASLKNKELLKAEILAMKKVREGKRIGIMMPQVISVEEVREVKKLLQELKADLDLGVMIETPAAVQIIEELCQEGISFISFGTNDLTQYTLAIDRGNEQVQYLYDEMNPSILSQLKKVISVCKKHNVETSICGQAGSKKEMVEFLVKLGIDSISVNADKAFEISKFVKELEDKGLRGKEGGLAEVSEGMQKKEKKKKEIYQVKCSECGKETSVPFKPDGIRAVYCKICLEVSRQKKLEKKEEGEQVGSEMAKSGRDNLGAEEEKIEERAEEKENTEEKVEGQQEPIKEEQEKKAGEEQKEEIKKQEEYPETDINIDVFSPPGFYEETSQEIISGEEKEEKEQKEEETETKEENKEEKQEVVLDIF